VGVLVVVALYPEVMLFVLFFGYAVLGAVFGVFKLGKNVRKIRPSVYLPAQVNEDDLVEEDEETGSPKHDKKL
jgi:CDP-diacylglycerol--serine O-phosphatidyltransferase